MIDYSLFMMVCCTIFSFENPVNLLFSLVSYSLTVFWIVGFSEVLRLHLCAPLVRLPRLWNL